MSYAKKSKKILDEHASIAQDSKELVDGPIGGSVKQNQIKIRMANYQNLFQVGHTLIRQQFLKRNLPTHEFAEKACCDHERLKRFLDCKETISGREWSNIVAELKINVDEWVEIADANPVLSMQPRSIGGCGIAIDPTADKHIKTVLGILGDFYRQASQNFRDQNKTLETAAIT